MKTPRTPISGILFLITIVAGCAASPERQIRERLAAGAAAVERGDRSAMADMISAGYADGSGHDKQGVLGGLALLTRGQRTYILLDVKDVKLTGSGRAEVDAVAALAGRPVEDLGALDEAWADLYRLNLQLTDEGGTWRIVTARWQPMGLSDLF
jgi:hypothetical protein